MRFENFSMAGFAVFTIAVAAPAFAEDLIVRYREPQNGISQARTTTWSHLGKGAVKELGLLNESEGIVKLRFATHEAAETARAELLRSDRVLGVADNHFYRPALSLTARPAEARETVFQLRGFPFSGVFANAGIPEVDLPPSVSDVMPGADPLVAKDWAMKNIRMPQAPSIAPDASRLALVAAVIDTGIDYNHEDLKGALWRNPANPREVGYDFAHNVAQPYDVVQFDIEGCLQDPACALGLDTSKFLTNPGHGTHCAGHVGAVANNSLGIAGVGAAANVQVMGLKFFYDVGDEHAGQGDDAAAIKSIDYAIRNGVKVISASWGGRMTREAGNASELKQALVRAQKAGILFVVAAGNDGIDQETDQQPVFPAAYTDLDNLIVVAASDSKDQLASFSNYGSKSVHIAAPGVKILSTTVGSKYSDLVGRFKDYSGKEQEISWDGTSMATPIVAGAVALVWTKYPRENYQQIRDRILKSARGVSALAGKVTTGGILDVSAALN